ncbi:hypothetical protein [Hymenobacter weizhouensis]|uniref:hypothetical protein n=1 Tax=Hymenobacter sp. YIM 151500-1 TaxID=2987689 RepID=UPI0022269584|nr:hypothetical protein [Hymenobacter sp. YIM 151500-1]UYZ61789.1 hypothetical protein OIS53_12330 [Hymenobacter sp. YIM 151500-1]
MTHTEIRDKVVAGGQLAIQRLLDRKRRDNGYVVVSQNGKVVRVLAADIKL